MESHPVSHIFPDHQALEPGKKDHFPSTLGYSDGLRPGRRGPELDLQGHSEKGDLSDHGFLALQHGRARIVLVGTGGFRPGDPTMSGGALNQLRPVYLLARILSQNADQLFFANSLKEI